MGCHTISDDSMIQVIRHCTMITNLNISGCKQFTDPMFYEMAQHLTNLTVSKWGNFQTGY